MFSFLKSKFVEKSVAVFAVETGGVTLTVVQIGADGKGQIAYAKRRSLETLPDDSPKDTLRKLSDRIEDIFQEISALKHHHLISKARTLVLLGSPWNLSWKESIVVQKDKPFRVTDDFIKDAVKNAFTKTHKGLSIISSHVMKMKMNGYTLSNPIGKTTASVEFEVYAESAPDEALLVIGDAISKHLPHGQIRFSTMMFASVDAIAQSLRAKDFIMVLPEHDVTELAIVKGGSIQAGASMPTGSLTISQELFLPAGGQAAKNDKISPKEALSKTKRFIAGALDATSMAAAVKTLDKIKGKFSADFRNLLWGMNESVLCPSAVFIGGRNIASYFMDDWIKKEDYASQTFTVDCLKVSVLGGGDIVPTNKLSGAKEIFFASAVSVVAAEALSRSLSSSRK